MNMINWSPDPSIQKHAMLSCALPIVAWASQAIVVLAGVRGPAALLLVIAGVQFLLLIGGMVFAGKVVSLGRTNVAAKSWWLAIGGLLISLGTVGLILFMAISSYR